MNPVVLNRLGNSFERPEEALHIAVCNNDLSLLRLYLFPAPLTSKLTTVAGSNMAQRSTSRSSAII